MISKKLLCAFGTVAVLSLVHAQANTASNFSSIPDTDPVTPGNQGSSIVFNGVGGFSFSPGAPSPNFAIDNGTAAGRLGTLTGSFTIGGGAVTAPVLGLGGLTIDDGATGYLKFFDHDGNGKAWYSFDQSGVHFIGLNNVLNFKAGMLAELGDEQIAWMKNDLARVSRSTPIVVLGHIPLWTVWEPWGWGTADSAQALALLRPFGSVTVLNGHIHQVLQKVEGNVALHTAMSLAYPLPTPGQAGIGEPGPVTVPAGELGKLLGTRNVSVVRGRHELAMIDTPLDH